MWTVDIDVGGTLTDGIFTRGDQVVCVKVDSTPHDLTVCLFDCLAQGAAKLGFAEPMDLLENVELIRWSTTITSNVLAEQRGPRIGLLVSQGHEKDLYGKQSPSVVLGRLLAEGDVVGLNGSRDETVIMNAVRSLLENGVRRICVSLHGAGHEQREAAIKKIVDRQYPDHFLGSVPVLAGSDMAKGSDDSTRTCYALINAYTHGALAATLFKAEDELRETYRYPGAFLVSHVNGGVAGIYKTKAIDTIESGPILGLQGSAYMARHYALSDVIALDVGGTTAKVGVLRKSEAITRKPSDFFGITVNVALPYLRSIALGGGSVVKPAGHAQVQLGPESMGSFPGPACYALGGDQATLTDAFVTAGLINPEYFLGGAKPLDAQLARKTIEELIAHPLQLSTEQACQAIIDRAFIMVADLVNEAQADLREKLSRHALFAYGGNGGLFACGVAEKLGLETVYLFALGPVFSAFGSSVSDISHLYERGVAGIQVSPDGIEEVRDIVREMKTESVQDLLGEGISPDEVAYTVELELSQNGTSVSASCAELTLRAPGELQAAVETALAAAGTFQGRDFQFKLVRLRARKAMPKSHLGQRSLVQADSAHARIGSRPVAWGSRGAEAQIFRWESLQPGNQVAGPAVLEGANTTYLVPENWAATIDPLGNAVVKRTKKD
ncbi:MAG TPA: hydantoinase/oxoprolinase family protein [Terriglobales bacterium]|nr:hydantoinase/oxoprolinase family protein [Terriglobales bacterium]